MKFNKIFISLFIVLPILVWGSVVAKWETTMGDFYVELYPEIVPITANNFINLTNQEFYNGTIFHRVIDGFVVQGGSPTGLGNGGPGYTIEDEFDESLTHVPGVISMANSGPNTGGSQYFITLEPAHHLDNRHSVFGKVIRGMDIVQNIGDVAVDGDNRPIVEVATNTLKIVTPQIAALLPEENTVNVELNETVSFMVVASGADIDNYEYKWYKNDVQFTNQNQMFFNYNFTQEGVFEIKLEIVNGEWIKTQIWEVRVGNTSATHINEKVNAVSVYPNPFNPNLTIKFDNPKASNTNISILNLKGQVVKRFKNQAKQKIELNWNGIDEKGNKMPSGIYFVKVNSSNKTKIKKVLLLK